MQGAQKVVYSCKMITLTPILKWNKDKTFLLLVLSLAIGGATYCFTPSYLYHSNVIIGLLLFGFSVFVTGKQRNNYAYLAIIVVFGSLALTYNLRIGYFFALGFFIIWLIEYQVGRLNPIILFLLIFMSPFFTQVTTILGFPIRLHLSNISGTLLKMAGIDAQVDGNIIVLDGAAFSVDEACMGLHMLAMSMLIGVFILSYRYRTTDKNLGLFQLSLFFTIVLALNVVTNLFRIIILVFFRIPPEHYVHQIMGLLCFLCYTVIPLYLISGWIMRNGVVAEPPSPARPKTNVFRKVAVLMLAAGIVITGVRVDQQKEGEIPMQEVTVYYPHGNLEKLNDGITKIATDNHLIYVKPIPEFFSGEHTPLMCWKGSGYVFNGIKEIVVDGSEIYYGKLVRDKEELYTAWWYTNGEIQTIAQLNWRMRMLKGEKFCLINITARDQNTLLAGINNIINNTPLVFE
jgi:exosortase N